MPDSPGPEERRYVVVAPLASVPPLSPGDRFTTREWPLHVTLVPTFFAAITVDDVAQAMERAAATLSPLTLVVGADALFGPRHTVPVSEVVPTPGLLHAHETLVGALGQVRPESPSYWRHGFRAHVTHPKDQRVHPGDQLELTQLALVDMQPGQALGMRAVLAVSPLSRGTGGHA